MYNAQGVYNKSQIIENMSNPADMIRTDDIDPESGVSIDSSGTDVSISMPNSGKYALKQEALYLSNMDDEHHKLVYDSELNGPKLTGFKGGSLGTSQHGENTDILNWNREEGIIIPASDNMEWVSKGNEARGQNAYILNDSNKYKKLMITGRRENNKREIGLWDNVFINSDLNVKNNICMGGSDGKEVCINKNQLKQLKIHDTRNDNKNPQHYRSMGQGVYREFKLNNKFGLGNSGYFVLQTTVPWPDTTGGSVTQIAYLSDARLHSRAGNSNDSGWGGWK